MGLEILDMEKKKIKYSIYNSIFRAIFLFIISGIVLWFIGINDPFVGSYSANDSYIALGAKNYLKYGYQNLNFLPTYYVGHSYKENIELYLHHPFLQFLITSIAFKIFGIHNWVVRLVPLIFSLGSVFFIYKIGSVIWNKKTGLISAAFASIMPFLAIFGSKLVMFEHATLFWLLTVFYFFIRYYKTGKGINLLFLTLASLAGILTDWGGFYLLPVLIINTIFRKNPKKLQALSLYIFIIIVGITFFLTVVYLSKGSFNDLITSIALRMGDKELFSLSYPWIRLSFITLLRCIIYFGPLVVFFSSVILLRTIKKLIQKDFSEENLIILSLFIMGMINFLGLPGSTWGHIYFIYYWVPFFALASASFFNNRSKQKILIFSFVISLIWSFTIVFFKTQQRTKQVWRYYVAKEINNYVEPYTEVGVYQFPGDLLEYYFDYPTKSFSSYNEVVDYLTVEGRYLIFSCWSVCSQEDFEFLNSLSSTFVIQELKNKRGAIWLISSGSLDEVPNNNIVFENQNILSKNQDLTAKNIPLAEKLYRSLRDFLNVGQL